jgi:hypothetical protein
MLTMDSMQRGVARWAAEQLDAVRQHQPRYLDVRTSAVLDAKRKATQARDSWVRSRGDADRCIITASDSSGSASFFGQVSIEWPENETSTQFVQFSNFPLQADQMTPVDRCNLVLSLVKVDDPNSGSEISATVWTLAQADSPG